MSDAQGSHVFLSYRSLERQFALKLAAALRIAGVRVWVDDLPEGIRPGDDWPSSIQHALNSCRALIAVVSPEYVRSRTCLRELNHAYELSRPIFPVLLRPVDLEHRPGGLIPSADDTVRAVFQVDPHLAGRCVVSGIEVSTSLKEEVEKTLRTEMYDLQERIIARELEKNPNMSSSSQRMMEDAVENYFGGYSANLQHFVERLPYARHSAGVT